ncbi:uncharacterized protein LOC114273190 [Camellia sinensis]|uniref:uncharacterized protein LOC114273190 n=1 Tax=Camellia sinensis TaxID=4442 RepID=UPI001035BFC4|nr:uncharacterized protein LOC114273190 [Camellia sinensis]
MSALLTHAMANNQLSGISLCRSSPRLSHLFFADDSLLFAAATEDEAGVLRDVLQIYEQASGQKINFQKSTVCFSKNTDLVTQQVTSILGVGSMATYGKYLGLPYCVGHSKRSVLGFVKERVWHRLNGWKEKLLSVVGREVLIKSVAQALPTYIMSCF